MIWFATHVLPWANAGLQLVNLSLLIRIVASQRQTLAKLNAGPPARPSGVLVMLGRSSDLQRPDDAAAPPTDPLRH